VKGKVISMPNVTTFGMVLGPGEFLSYTHGKTPNYTLTSPLEDWRSVTISEQTVTAQDKEKQAVEQWVAETIRRELAPALEKLEKKTGKVFKVSLGVTEARLITQALRAGRKPPKASRKKRPSRRGRK
jgi:hypothetical protein